MFVDSINRNNQDYTLSAFGNILMCSNSVSDAKTVVFPEGYNLDENLSFKVLFINGHNCADASTYMTLNSVIIVTNKNGTLIPLPIHSMTQGSSTVYKSLQANTILEMYYTNNYDGNNTPAFVIVGNPIVISDNNYTIYANGMNPILDSHPLHSLYWSSSSTNPSVIFGGGTWTPITDRFILSKGSTYTTVAEGNATSGASIGGSSTVTLTVQQMPYHTHTMENAGSHTHTTNSQSASSFRTSTTIYDSNGTEITNTGGMSANSFGCIRTMDYGHPARQGDRYGNISAYKDLSGYINQSGGALNTDSDNVPKGIAIDVSHTHNMQHNHTVDTSHTHGTDSQGSHKHTINYEGGLNGTTQAHENMPPYIVKYCWERTA